MAEIMIDLRLTINVPDRGIKINNLLYQLKEFMPEVFFGILRAIFSAVEEDAIAKLKKQSPGRYVRNGRQSGKRQIRTAYGLFQYKLARLYDKRTKKTLTPLCDAIGLPRYCRHMKEAAEGGIGLVCHLSYRRSAKEIDRILGTGMSKSTLHRQVQEFSRDMCNWPELKGIPYRFLMVDGTKVRLQQQGKKGQSKKVEMRWAMASLEEKGKFELVGIWLDKSWKEIRKELEKRLNYSNLEVLFCDGGPGIEDNLLADGMRVQRCILHGKRDFPYILYADNLKKAQQKPFKDKLKSIPVMNLTQRDLELLRPEDLPEVKRLAEKTKQGFKELIDALPAEKYPTARTYIENLSRDVTTFFDFWFANKVWIRLDTNAIESGFSQVKNRIWAVGKRWSETGLMNWLKVVVKKIFFPDTWNKLWDEYLDIDTNLTINLMEVRYQWL
ncbi:MAG: hypothetical protein D6710_01210 [Nitrospirae bacterium]|nr:MAG: hypothetical protein D6710_01210 [Nitrospirota bacterium]